MRWVSAQRRRQRGLQERGPPRARACMASARNSQTEGVLAPRARASLPRRRAHLLEAELAQVGRELHAGGRPNAASAHGARRARASLRDALSTPPGLALAAACLHRKRGRGAMRFAEGKWWHSSRVAQLAGTAALRVRSGLSFPACVPHIGLTSCQVGAHCAAWRPLLAAWQGLACAGCGSRLGCHCARRGGGGRGHERRPRSCAGGEFPQAFVRKQGGARSRRAAGRGRRDACIAVGA